jgi:uncharacterized membrane protein YjjP (DUF1212 family)
MHPPATNAEYTARIAFVVELAERLHSYGTTAQRLEAAVDAVAQKLGLECEPWSNPTGMVLSFNDPARPGGESDTTRVIRLAPGDTDLSKLCEADRIAEEVMAGHLDVASGHAALRALDAPPGFEARAMQVLGFGLAAAGMAGVLRLPWLDIATAGITGLLIGLLQPLTEARPQLREAADAIAGLIAGAVAVLVAGCIAPLNLNTVIIVSLIVLLPGMSLTNAVNELTSQHLVSGTARFAGALATVMKLTVGTMIALTVAGMLGLHPLVRASHPQPAWLGWASLLVVAYALAVLFRAERRDYPLVMAAVVLAYVVSYFASQAWGGQVGIFLSALAMTAGGNAYARWGNRPGALVRLPGIIVLVPGSASLRGLLEVVQQQDVGVGRVATLGVINILLALVAGLLFGNLLLPTRRNL